MGNILGNIIVTNPWVFVALAGLPLLWLLLKITPPAPNLIRLPSARFLQGLLPDKQETRKTPLWLLVLRMLIISLVILSLSGPVYNPGSGMAGSGTLRLLIDNGWSAAHIWQQKIRTGENILKQAERAGRTVVIQTTAPQPGKENPFLSTLMSAGDALSLLRALEPLPWPADYQKTASVTEAETIETEQGYETIWLSDGIWNKGTKSLVTALKSGGSLLHYMKPGAEGLPLVLGIGKRAETGAELFQINAPRTIKTNHPVTVQALAEDGRILDYKKIRLNSARLPESVRFEGPQALGGDIAQYKIAGQYGAAGVFLLDTRLQGRKVAIITQAAENKTPPLADSGYYLRRALEPYTSIISGNINEVIEQGVSMIILPDIGAMPVETMNILNDWVDRGGLLLRFAGPNMTQMTDRESLLPVPLRRSSRVLEGTLTWDKPLKLGAFPGNSPFYGIPIPDDLSVKTQILPGETTDLEGKIWAALKDGTPLITAKPQENGLLVLVHVTATPEWSGFPVSGLFVEVLKRLNALSGRSASAVMQGNARTLEPIAVLDGFGRLQKPQGHVKPLQAKNLEDAKIDAEHPPGIYGSGAVQMALNIGTQGYKMRAIQDLPMGVAQSFYDADYEMDLSAYILWAAAGLLLLDWLLMILIGLSFRIKQLLRKKFMQSLILSALMLQTIQTVSAETTAIKSSDLIYANGLFLAHIKTGDIALDSLSHQGLENLSKELKRRTSIEPDGVAAVNPETDTLGFFPWIYWPVSLVQKPLTDEAAKNIQTYLNNGGTILLDLREGTQRKVQNTQKLRALTSGLSLPPLHPMPKTHVLTKTFYLLEHFPGRHSAGKLWVESGEAEGRDGVSPVIIGSNDWATAWAAGKGQGTLMGGSRQKELAMRAGVNFTLYALTGSYKADQLHVKRILERLDR